MQPHSHDDRRTLAEWIAAASIFIASTLNTTATSSGADDETLAAAMAVEQRFAEVIAQAESGVVAIARRDDRADTEPQRVPAPFGRPQRPESITLEETPQFFGTGVVIGRNAGDTQRYVLTNDHVLRGGRPEAPLPETTVFDVRLSKGRTAVGSIVAADPRSDLAVLKLDLQRAGIRPEEVTPLKLGDGSDLRKGQLVLAMGNPYALARDGSASASWGMISNISRRPAKGDDDDDRAGMGTIHQFGTLLHVDTRLDLGMSGGALINLKGELVGLTTSLAALRGYEKSVGYAIPIDAAMRRVIDDLLNGLEVEYGFLGISPQDATPQDLRALRVPTEYVSAARSNFVSWDSPADRAGLHREDLILRINDVPIRNAADLMREVGLLGPEQIANLLVWRRSERRPLSLKVTLGKWPVQDDSKLIATQRRYPDWRGLSVDYSTARRRLQTSDVMERYHRAVLVTEVRAESPAAAAGVRVGDFITHLEDVPIETPREFHAAARGLDAAVTLVRLDGSQIEVPMAAE